MSNQIYNAKGSPVECREDALASSATTSSAKACLNMINGNVTFVIEVDFNPNSYPYHITGGKIISGICGPPWEITGGSMGTSLTIDATRQGTGSCANTITIVGNSQFPSSWSGTYGFNGSSTLFSQTTLFKQFDQC